jgi:MGT family glycosyltransferase
MGMSNVLFLSVPAHGNVNPTLGLVSELVQQGEQVCYFASDEFKEKIETAGATYKRYAEDLDFFKAGGSSNPLLRVIRAAPDIIADILEQTSGQHFDYLIHSAGFPFTKAISQILQLPTVSSLAIVAGHRHLAASGKFFEGTEEMREAYTEARQKIQATYSIIMPETIRGLIFNIGEINLAYTSKLFTPDIAFYDDSYKFVGPPVYNRKENLDFPFEKLKGRTVIYISLGTVFSNFDAALYDIFFKAFKDWNAVVVLAAFNVDLFGHVIPENFIVRNYVPQSAILEYTSAAVTHAGMNSISDLVTAHIPFVALPLGADQPLLAKQAEMLGAAIALDTKKLTPEVLSNAVKRVMTNPSYLENINRIDQSFKAAGGYPKAVEEIFRWKSKNLY